MFGSHWLDHRYAGSILAIISAAGFASMDAATQIVFRRGISSEQSVLFRMLTTLVFLPIYLIKTDPQNLALLSPFHAHPPLPVDASSSDTNTKDLSPGTVTALIWTRAFTEGSGICLAMASLEFVPVSEAITVFNIRPFPTAVMCWLILGEKFGWKLISAAVVSMSAMLLIIQPPFLFDPASIVGDTASRVKGFSLIVTNTVLNSAGLLIARRLGAWADPLVLPVAYAVAGVLCSLFVMYLRQSALTNLTDFVAWFQIACLTVMGFLGQVTVVAALQRETAGKVAVLSYFQIPFTVILQVAFLGDSVNLADGVGMAVIIAAGVWITLDTENDKAGKAQPEADGYAMLPTAEGADSEVPSTRH